MDRHIAIDTLKTRCHTLFSGKETPFNVCTEKQHSSNSRNNRKNCWETIGVDWFLNRGQTEASFYKTKNSCFGDQNCNQSHSLFQADMRKALFLIAMVSITLASPVELLNDTSATHGIQVLQEYVQLQERERILEKMRSFSSDKSSRARKLMLMLML